MRQLKNFSNKDESTVNDNDVVKKYAGKYDGFSEDQLVDELIKTVRKAKQSDSYSEEQLQLFINMISPQLSEGQKAKLDSMVKLIKNGDI